MDGGISSNNGRLTVEDTHPEKLANWPIHRSKTNAGGIPLVTEWRIMDFLNRSYSNQHFGIQSGQGMTI